jgi:hypothetical protein
VHCSGCEVYGSWSGEVVDASVCDITYRMISRLVRFQLQGSKKKVCTTSLLTEMRWSKVIEAVTAAYWQSLVLHGRHAGKAPNITSPHMPYFKQWHYCNAYAIISNRCDIL